MNFSKLKQIWQARDLRHDIIFVLFMLFVVRILAHIPIPGVDVQGLRGYLQSNQLLRLLNVFTGGGLENFSIIMLGVGPYITASIIFQLLTMVVPRIEELSKEGERGRALINQWTRYLTVPLAILQGYGTMIFLSQQGGIKILSSMNLADRVTALVTITAGT